MHLKYTSIENVKFMEEGQVWPNLREGAVLAVTHIWLKKPNHLHTHNWAQWMTVVWDSDIWMGQLPKPLYICQNVTQMNMLLHLSPRHTSCKFHDILTILRWSLKLSHSAVPVPHHSQPLYMSWFLFWPGSKRTRHHAVVKWTNNPNHRTCFHATRNEVIEEIRNSKKNFLINTTLRLRDGNITPKQWWSKGLW